MGGMYSHIEVVAKGTGNDLMKFVCDYEKLLYQFYDEKSIPWLIQEIMLREKFSAEKENIMAMRCELDWVYKDDVIGQMVNHSELLEIAIYVSTDSTWDNFAEEGTYYSPQKQTHALHVDNVGVWMKADYRNGCMDIGNGEEIAIKHLSNEYVKVKNGIFSYREYLDECFYLTFMEMFCNELDKHKHVDNPDFKAEVIFYSGISDDDDDSEHEDMSHRELYETYFECALDDAFEELVLDAMGGDVVDEMPDDSVLKKILRNYISGFYSAFQSSCTWESTVITLEDAKNPQRLEEPTKHAQRVFFNEDSSKRFALIFTEYQGRAPRLARLRTGDQVYLKFHRTDSLKAGLDVRVEAFDQEGGSLGFLAVEMDQEIILRELEQEIESIPAFFSNADGSAVIELQPANETPVREAESQLLDLEGNPLPPKREVGDLYGQWEIRNVDAFWETEVLHWDGNFPELVIDGVSAKHIAINAEGTIHILDQHGQLWGTNLEYTPRVIATGISYIDTFKESWFFQDASGEWFYYNFLGCQTPLSQKQKTVIMKKAGCSADEYDGTPKANLKFNGDFFFQLNEYNDVLRISVLEDGGSAESADATAMKGYRCCLCGIGDLWCPDLYFGIDENNALWAFLREPGQPAKKVAENIKEVCSSGGVTLLALTLDGRILILCGESLLDQSCVKKPNKE